MFLTEESPAAQQTQTPTLNAAHSWRELWSRQTEPTSHHTELPVCPRALHGDNATTHGRAQAPWEAGRDQPSPPSRWGALKKNNHPKPTSLGLGNELGIWKPG